MRRGFLVGAVAGGVLSLAVGLIAALLPTTPTWTLWRIKSALDRHDVAELTEIVDFAAVTQRALTELDDGPQGLDVGKAAMALLSGGKVLTVFNDPERPLRITAGDVVTAWWGMRREGDLAYLTLPTGDRPVDLVLGRAPDLRWRIVGITPLAALIKVKAPPSGRTTRASSVDAHGGDG
ncbi:MAG: DUF2939 domain-containing protein [Thermodesulfobacteriota bacterium]